MLTRIFFITGFILLIFISFLFFSPSQVAIFLQENHEIIETHLVVFTVGVFIFYAISFAFTIPLTTILGISTGYALPFWHAYVLLMSATIFGAVVLFLYARKNESKISKKVLDSAYPVLIQEAKESPISFLLGTRFAPFVPYPIAHIIPAKAGVPIFHFIWTTFVGTFPATALFVAFGNSVRNISGGIIPDFPLLFLIVIACSFIILGFVFVHRYQVKNLQKYKYKV